MGLFNTSATMTPKVIESAIMQQYRQSSTGKALFALNNVDSYIIESSEEQSTRGGFKFIDKEMGVPDYIQTLYKKATRSMHPFDASLKIELAELKVRPDIARDRVRVAGDEWASFVDTLAYDVLKDKAGFTETGYTAWNDTNATPVEDLSLVRAKIGKSTKGRVKPDTVIMGEYAWHYLAVSAKLIDQNYSPTGPDAYIITGKLKPILGMNIIVTEAVGDDVYVLKQGDCGKWDQFLPPTTIITEGVAARQPLVQAFYDMYEWGEPSVSKPTLISRLVGVGAIAEA